jgi:hypothetical protein
MPVGHVNSRPGRISPFRNSKNFNRKYRAAIFSIEILSLQAGVSRGAAARNRARYLAADVFFINFGVTIQLTLNTKH